MMIERLLKTDAEIAKIMEMEHERQTECLVMIPSENYPSPEVLMTQGCLMTNKYAEGYPGERYYNGCKFVDMVEIIAMERLREIFKAEHANVQPHSGTQANMAVYYAMLETGDTILAMDLHHGGHLSHGKKQNFSGRYYKFCHYGVNVNTETINYDEVEQIARECKPKLIVVGASAYPRILDFKKWRAIADGVGAYLMADIAHIAGLIVGGVHPDPVPYADVITGTTHKTLRGPRGAFILCRKKFAEKIDKAVFPGVQAGPLMNIIAAKAVAFGEAKKEDFKEYQKQVVKNAKMLAECLVSEGFRLVSGGTDNHLMLVDLTEKNVTGMESANILEEAGIICNKNVIPFDTRSPFVASGIRFGSPAITSRGMKEDEMKTIADWISRILHNPEDADLRKKIKEDVKGLCGKFPVYKDYR